MQAGSFLLMQVLRNLVFPCQNASRRTRLGSGVPSREVAQSTVSTIWRSHVTVQAAVAHEGCLVSVSISSCPQMSYTKRGLVRCHSWPCAGTDGKQSFDRSIVRASLSLTAGVRPYLHRGRPYRIHSDHGCRLGLQRTTSSTVLKSRFTPSCAIGKPHALAPVVSVPHLMHIASSSCSVQSCAQSISFSSYPF